MHTNSGIADPLAGTLTRIEAAKVLRRSTRTISKMFNEPDGLAYIVHGRAKLTTIEFIKDYLERRTHRPNPRRKAA